MTVAHARGCTIISPVTVALFAGPAKLPLESTKEIEAQPSKCYAMIYLTHVLVRAIYSMMSL